VEHASRCCRSLRRAFSWWRADPAAALAVAYFAVREGREAVDSLSFDVPPGRVTGFPGPNGAGKPDTGL
jgi:ABC-2 type transport system ATP-binding protein